MTDREQFEKARKHLYALADRMGMKLTIIVRRKNPITPPATNAKPGTTPRSREPGEE